MHVEPTPALIQANDTSPIDFSGYRIGVRKQASQRAAPGPNVTGGVLKCSPQLPSPHKGGMRVKLIKCGFLLLMSSAIKEISAHLER